MLHHAGRPPPPSSQCRGVDDVLGQSQTHRENVLTRERGEGKCITLTYNLHVLGKH